MIRHLGRRLVGPVGQAVANGAGIQLALLVSGVLSARLLGPHDRGQQVLLTTIPSVSAFLGALGLPQALTYFLAKDARQGALLLRRLRWWLIVLGMVALAIQAAILGVLVKPARIDAVLADISFVLFFIMQFVIAHLQGSRLFGRSFLVQSSGPVVFAIGLVIAYASRRSSSVTTVMSIWVVALGATVALGLWFASAARRPEDRATLSMGEAPSTRVALGFGLRGLLGVSSPIETLRVDQLVVGLALSRRDLGFYSAALAFANAPKLLGQAVGAVAAPTLAAAGITNRRPLLKKYIAIGTLLTFFAAAVLETVVKWLVPLLYGDAFRPAISLAQLLIVAGAFMAIRRLMSDCARGIGRPGLGSQAEVASWVVLVPAFVVLVPIFGRLGVGAAVLASAAASAALLGLTLDLATRAPYAVSPTDDGDRVSL